ncbi:MAG: hypothetical protein IT546_16930 [Caulobacteraceae bacterium]|nr:hypothetical protein [Caulobacteraceae bacterium]
MRRLGIGLAAALMVAAFATGASAQKKRGGEITEAARTQGMAEAPALAQQVKIACQITDARFIGKMDDKKAKTSTSFYEVDCDQGLGYVIQLPAGGAPSAFSCLETAAPQDDGKDSGLKCKLPGNANPTADLAPLLAKAGVPCTVEKARSIGQSPTNTYMEVACQGGSGYVLVAGSPANVSDAVQANTCLAYAGGGNINCTLTDAAAALKVVDPLVASAGKNCTIKDRRYVLTTKDGANYFEVSCEDGKGYVLEQGVDGSLKRTIDCANASFVDGGCRLTDARAAQTEQAGLYTKLATAAGFKCNVAEYALLTQRDNEEVIELKCSDRPDGAVGVFPASGKATIYDCGRAELVGFRCALTIGPENKKQLTADLQKLGKNSCTVAEQRVVGKLSTGNVIMEVSCSDGLAGYMMEYGLNPVAPKEAVVCTMAKSMAGGCKIPANVKASS